MIFFYIKIWYNDSGGYVKVLLYTEGYKTIRKSGLGKAINHQMQALEDNNIDYTTDPKDDFDILHINTYWPKSYFFTKKAKKKGKKVIYHAHSTEEDFRNSFLFSNLVSPLFKKWISKCYRLGDIIITPTEYSKKLLEGYDLKRPIKAISNGVDTTFFEKNDKFGNKFRKTYGYKKDDKVIVGIGLYIERKGLLDFVALAKMLPQYKFIWFGESPLWASPRKIRKAVHTKLPNLTFAGYVEQDMIRNALSGADLYIFPTLEETEGIPIIEALSAQIPTLVRDIPIFDEYDNVVYKAKDVDDFAKQTTLILEGKLPNLTKKGYKAAKKKDIKAVGQELAKTYREVSKMPVKKEEEKPKMSKVMYFRNLALILSMIVFFIGLMIKTDNFSKYTGLGPINTKKKEEVGKQYQRTINSMDSEISVSIYAKDESKANKALDEIETIYKTYDELTDRSNPDSELSKIYNNALDDKNITIDHKLYQLIKYGYDWYDKSEGKFNINNGDLTDLWGKYYEKKKGRPSSDELNEAIKDIKDIVLLDNDQIKNNHANINLDSIKFAYATDRAVDTLNILGITTYMISSNGNMIVGDYPGNTGKYNIVVAGPYKNGDDILTTLRITNKAVASVGRYQKYYEDGDKTYSLIVDSETGLEPAHDTYGVTVVGTSLADATVLAYAAYIMPIDDGQKLINNLDDTEAIWAYTYFGSKETVISDHFYNLN